MRNDVVKLLEEIDDLFKETDRLKEKRLKDEWREALDNMNFHIQESKKYHAIVLEKYQEWCELTGKVVEL